METIQSAAAILLQMFEAGDENNPSGLARWT